MNPAEHPPIDALRQLLRSGPEAPPRALQELLPRVSALLQDAAEAGGAEAAARAGQCVFLLGALLRAERDPAQMARLYQALAAAGRLGRALIGLHAQARVLALPQLSPLLLVLPERDFLALLNDLLLDSPPEDKPFAAWLKGLLPAPGRLDAREALLFLKALSGEGAPLARPLREALCAAGLGEILARSLAAGPGPATAGTLLTAAELLDDPAARAEALHYALRSAGAEGPSRLPPLLDAPADTQGRDAALGAELRRLALLQEGRELLLPAAQAEPELLGLVLANLLQGGQVFAASALRLLPLLPRPGLLACLAELPEGLRPALHARLLQVAAALEPELLLRAVKTLGAGLAPGDPAAQALAGLLAARPAETCPEPPEAPPAGPAAPLPKTAQNRRPSLAEAVRDALAPIRDQDFAHSVLADQVLDGLAFSDTDLSHCRFSGVTFRAVRLNGVLLARGLFERCLFQSCTFSGADLSAGQFRSCRFEDCAFESCDLSHARLSGCVLAGCAFAESSLAGAALAKTRLQDCTLRACALGGAQFRECALTRGGFSRSDLAACVLDRCLWRGAELVSCSLAGALLAGCECLGLTLARCAAAELAFRGGHTDNPQLARARRACRLDRLEAAALASPPQALLSGPGAQLARTCAEAILRVDEARRSLAALRGQDQRRRELALERLGETQGRFLTLLPALLAGTAFERALGLADVPPCALAGHAFAHGPAHEALALLERHFPGLEAQADPPAPVLMLEAVYAMGSLGTVAQKPDSDLDCWVCVRPAQGAALRPGAREALGRKLAALEDWAGREYGLELHFFLMELEEVRRNDFGMSDRESSGTAQAAMLKEEFCRTALKLGGRDLLWWAAPPSAGPAEAEALLAELERLDPRCAAELTDLGQPSPIPAEEYFGACLWQMVKALGSPYKSVMKLALLEKYAGQGRDGRLLCDGIKAALLRGRRRARDTDPYLALFMAVREHYRALADDGSLALLDECLRLKAEADPEDLAGDLAAPLAAPGPEAGQDQGAFAAAMRLGGMVSLFMTRAYRRIQAGLKADRGAARISPEDLTRLGRRVAASFAQQPHKLGLVPFLSRDLLFTELFFYAEKAPGKRSIWGVKGKDRSAGKAAVESLAPIRRDADVVRLLAWLVVNGLFEPRQTVHAEKSLAPVALTDLQFLLADLLAFFPPGATLEPDMDEYLRPERVVRAYVIGNLPVAPDKNKLLSVSVLYATNWGEVFCRSFENPPPLLAKSARDFLREALDKPLPGDLELRVFTPKKSACPRIRPG